LLNGVVSFTLPQPVSKKSLRSQRTEAITQWKHPIASRSKAVTPTLFLLTSKSKAMNDAKPVNKWVDLEEDGSAPGRSQAICGWMC
jgi:hypothetical protein